MGLLRFYLALSVIVLHSGGRFFGLEVPNGFLAVQFFFTISGFYMALVLNEKYTASENIAFFRNRAIRIFPAYWFSLILVLFSTQRSAFSTIRDLTFLDQIIVTFFNIFLLGQDALQVLCITNSDGNCIAPSSLSLNGPSWSLSVEIIFYIFAPFIMRSPKKIILMLVSGSIYQVLIHKIQIPKGEFLIFKQNDLIQWSYNFYPASMMFFAMGGLVYFAFKNKSSSSLYLLVCSLVPLSIATDFTEAWVILIFVLAIPNIFELTKNNKVDKLFGELSYPIYIFHFPILHILQSWEDSIKVFELAEKTAIATVCLAILFHKFLELPIQRKFKDQLDDKKKYKRNLEKLENCNPKYVDKIGYFYTISPILFLYLILVR
jgi:peptidoglycan/LPS O-acetylase OafA/YrhL